mmetsp:Transcript_23962/g.38600  ORF Transcript_23962/g.38600 Transcript_23962/m.38600 type:complete len:331 (+) Transcript_23962:734-1726(+)
MKQKSLKLETEKEEPTRSNSLYYDRMERGNAEKASMIQYRKSETPRHSRTRPRIIRHAAGRSLTIVPPSRRRGHSAQRPEKRLDFESSAMDNSNQRKTENEDIDKKIILVDSVDSADRERTVSDIVHGSDKKIKHETRGSSPSHYDFVTYEDSIHKQDDDAEKVEDLLDDVDSVASGETTRIDLESIPRGGTVDNFKEGSELCGNISESESIAADSPRSHSQSPRGLHGNLSCCGMFLSSSKRHSHSNTHTQTTEQMAEFCCMVSGGRKSGKQSSKKEFSGLVRQGDLKSDKIGINSFHASEIEIGENRSSLRRDYAESNAKEGQFCVLM